MNSIDRRRFLVMAGAAAAAASRLNAQEGELRAVDDWLAGADANRGACAISSGNGLRTVDHAWRRMSDGADPVVAIVEGVGIVEADPEDMTVGLGGLPNERGVVQLDASVMHGPTHKAGAVAAIEDILHPARVALKVLQTTDHVMIVGQGAKDFALAHGFEEEDLLTEAAREQWLRWKRNLSPNDDWLDIEQSDWNEEGNALALGDERAVDPAFTYGTIHCSAVNGSADLAGCTTTSGLSYKIPGRVGDSPIVGAGMYTDNEVGSAGATGRGESVIQSCGAFSVVERMREGLTPTEACLAVLKRINDQSVKQRRLRGGDGRPNFGVTLYAVRKDGAFGAATMWRGGRFTVCDGPGKARSLECAFLHERDARANQR